ncbi:DNA translocase FtsK [Streptococcus intermedius]|uniref:DNA translocase FtsK n=1 Tax=Streptococcus intermedius TaxID=1338 RepID=A0AAE8G0P8_STRIT|nr:FtsK/SpoIIIE domain-containing protein [Streptococcus intermedius]RSJ23628.1 DNA translocase FtsK [Streptococcus intermedius]
MRRVSVNWSYPFWASLSFIICSSLLLVLVYKYLNPIFLTWFGSTYNLYFYSFVVLVGLLYVFGLYRRNVYINRNKLKQFILMNHLYETEKTYNGKKVITESVEFDWIDKKDSIVIRAYKNGNLLDNIIDEIGDRLQAFLKLKLVRTKDEAFLTDYVFEVISDKRLFFFNSDEKKYINNTVIQLTEKIQYDVSKVSHGLTVGSTGSGKTMFINSKILSYAKMKADIFICDPKNVDLSLLKYVEGFPQSHIGVSHAQICRILRLVNEEMERRYEQYFSDKSAFCKTFVNFDLPPIVVFFDEVTAFMKTADKKVSSEAKEYLFALIMKGRQVGCFIEISMQRPDAEVLDGAIRDQLGCRVALGKMSKDGYRMIFDTADFEYYNSDIIGSGYITITGQITEPTYFETPFFSNDFDFIEELEVYYAGNIFESEE